MNRKAVLKLACPLAAFLAAGGLQPAIGSPDSSGGGECTLEGIRALVPAIGWDPSVAAVAIDSVKHVSGLGSHCEVIGHTITQNPGPNQVGWSVLLPDQHFAGRFLVQGQGGQGGRILVADAPGTKRLLATGIVFSSSDTGASSAEGRWAVENSAARLLDRDHRGAHVSVLAAKALTRAYYAMRAGDRLYSYHTGCSAGGAMVMAALRNYPGDFDGAVAGTATTGGANWSPYIQQYLLQHPDSWISPVKLGMLENAVARSCAGPDGLVRDPQACGFRLETLQCTGADGDQCLTPAEIGLARRITSPYPVAFNRTRAGFTMAMPTGWSSQIGNSRPTLASPENPWAPGNPPVTFTIANAVFRSTLVQDARFDFVKDARFDDPAFWTRIGGGMSDDLSKDAIWAFRRAGGKMITYSGLGENFAPPLAEAEYYQAMKRLDPAIDNFMRVYQLPGVQHCAGGPGPQDAPDRLLDAMIAWVEQGRAPAAVVANGGPNSTARTTLLCPFPKRATYKAGRGGFAFDASNWRCL